jgi:dephospho-CoA kinase
MGRIITVCGMPASGKGVFAEALAARQIPVLSMGDMIRAEVKRRGLEESPGIFGETASELRGIHGEGVLATRLIPTADAVLASNPIVLIEGLRGVAELEIFRSHWQENLLVVAIKAAKENRYDRVQARGRAEDGNREDFEIRDAREIGWGLDHLINDADIIFDNDASPGTLQEIVTAWLESL